MEIEPVKLDDIEAPNVICLKQARKDYGRCPHKKLIVNEEHNFIKCNDCGEKLNPIWVLTRYAKEETRLFKLVEYNNRLQKALEEKLRTKCKHCGKMTSVNVKVPWNE